MRHLLRGLLINLCFVLSAHAQGVATFTYQRGTIQVLRAHPPAVPNMPWQDESTPPQLANAAVDIAVDIRPSTSLARQEGWINMGSLSGLNAMMFVYEQPQAAPVMALEYYQPLDVLWVDANGTITSIAPHLNLSEIREPLADTSPSKALLMMAGGTVDEQNIAPGDKIIGSDFFRPPPKLLTITK